MEGERRRVVPDPTRKPLSDCTNSSASSSTPSVLFKRTKPNPSSSSSSAFKKSVTTTSSLPSHAGTIDRDVSEPISVVCRRRHTPDKRNCNNASNTNIFTPSGLPKTFSVAGTIDLDVSETISVFYSRRDTSDERKHKKKAVARTVIHTPIPKISNIRDKRGGVEGLELPKGKALTVPCRKKQRAVSYEQDVSKDALLQAFIEKQKAYFKEIDEFKLPEEEVESIDEMD